MPLRLDVLKVVRNQAMAAPRRSPQGLLVVSYQALTGLLGMLGLIMRLIPLSNLSHRLIEW